jgi:hypothetical protein
MLGKEHVAMSGALATNRLSEPPHPGSTGHGQAREIVEFCVTQEQLYYA